MLEFLFDFLKKMREPKTVELSLEDLVKGMIVTKQKDHFEGEYKEYLVLPIEFVNGKAIGIFSYKHNFFSREKRIEIPVGLKFNKDGKKDKFLTIEKEGYYNNLGKQKNTNYLSLMESYLKVNLFKNEEIAGEIIERRDYFNIVYLDYPSAQATPFALYLTSPSREAHSLYVENDCEIDSCVILNNFIVQEIEEKYRALKRKPLIKDVIIKYSAAKNNLINQTKVSELKGKKLTEKDFKEINDWANKNDF